MPMAFSLFGARKKVAKMVIWILLLILVLLFLFYVWMLRPNLPRRDMQALTKVDYAHRGLWNDARPENSLSAFRAAVDAGYGIELDVHRTKDGVLVVHHDDNLQRVCGVNRRIAQSTLAEVRACHLHGTDEIVPTLDEVLSVVGGRVPLIVELKVEQNVDSLCGAVRERMQRYSGAWCMESFDPRAVQWFRKNAPEIIRGQLAFGLGGEAAHKGVKPTTAFFIATLMQHVMSRPDFLAYEAISEHGLNLPMRLVRAMRPWMVAWTIRSQQALDASREKYDIAIFEGFVPPAKHG